ncbi:hypothetical protein [Kitasatospora indigofera]|uniref:hypothetical protein n=1 Tax=Kitasatospora indigofera TaxID=67307 RepID=UPI0033BEAA8E
MDAALGAGRGEEHLQMDPSTEMPVFPGLEDLLNGFELPATRRSLCRSPRQGSWSAQLLQKGGGASQHRWQQVAAPFFAGQLLAHLVAAAQVTEPVFTSLPLGTGMDAAAVPQTGLGTGLPFFGSARLDQVADGEQVLITSDRTWA